MSLAFVLLILSAAGEDVFPSPEKRSMYDWLDLLRSRLLAVPSDAFAALSDCSITIGFLQSINRLQLYYRGRP